MLRPSPMVSVVTSKKIRFAECLLMDLTGSCLVVPFSCLPPASNHVHTSAILQASHRKQQARSTRKINVARREELKCIQDANRPHVVLSTPKRARPDATLPKPSSTRTPYSLAQSSFPSFNRLEPSGWPNTSDTA